jgi:Delta24-sterol reductase
MLDHGPHQGLLRNPQNPEKKFEMFFDLGIYGIPKLVREKKPWDAKATLRQMEAWVRSRRGYQALYCDTFQVSAPALFLCRFWPAGLTYLPQTREELRRMFDHTLYDQVRVKYHAIGAFSELYDKIRPVKAIYDGCYRCGADSDRLLLRLQEPWLLQDRHEDDLL